MFPPITHQSGTVMRCSLHTLTELTARDEHSTVYRNCDSWKRVGRLGKGPNCQETMIFMSKTLEIAFNFSTFQFLPNGIITRPVLERYPLYHNQQNLISLCSSTYLRNCRQSRRYPPPQHNLYRTSSSSPPRTSFRGPYILY